MEDLHKKTSAKNYKVTSCNFKIILQMFNFVSFTLCKATSKF